MARGSDLVWVVSETERQALLVEDVRLNVEVLSLIHEAPAERIGYATRKGLGFVGGFPHAPNVDAVNFLVERIMPRIWAARTDVVLAVVGADIPAEVRALARPGVYILARMGALFSFESARARLSKDLAAFSVGVHGTRAVGSSV